MIDPKLEARRAFYMLRNKPRRDGLQPHAKATIVLQWT